MAKQDVISNGPSGRALKFLNNKNNLADLYLKKRLAQFDREKTFSVSHMDRDKFDTVDVLKQIHQCDSDLLPASQRYVIKHKCVMYFPRNDMYLKCYVHCTWQILPSEWPMDIITKRTISSGVVEALEGHCIGTQIYRANRPHKLNRQYTSNIYFQYRRSNIIRLNFLLFPSSDNELHLVIIKTDIIKHICNEKTF